MQDKNTSDYFEMFTPNQPSSKVRFVRDGYNYDVNQVSNETGLACLDATLAQQHTRDECDINNIINQFNITRTVPSQPLAEHFGDFSHVTDFQSALEALQNSRDEFMNLPANIRARFDNNPNNLIHFLENSENRAEAIKLGLVEDPSAAISAASENAAALSST